MLSRRGFFRIARSRSGGASKQGHLLESCPCFKPANRLTRDSQHASTADLAVLQRLERLVCLLQIEDLYLGVNPGVAGELQNQMGGRPKAIQAETSARVSPAQAVGTISDYSCAQQRRGIFVGELVRNGMGEGFVDKDELSIAAVHVIPGKLGVVTEVFEAAPAMIATAVGRMQPGNANPISFL